MDSRDYGNLLSCEIGNKMTKIEKKKSSVKRKFIGSALILIALFVIFILLFPGK